MQAKLYSICVSHPGHAARAMLEHKGVDHRVVDFLPGLHPLLLRAVGFRGGTVPALAMQGRRVQGSLAIARVLDELCPEPALFPAERDRREAVEQAELWGERELQPLPRRCFRWGMSHSSALRRWLAAEAGLPAPAGAGKLSTPIALWFARVSQADEEHVRADLAALPALLGRVDELIARGTLGGVAPTAADFQIASSVRVLMAFDDLHDALGRRPGTRLALRLYPDFPGPVPAFLPRAWLP